MRFSWTLLAVPEASWTILEHSRSAASILEASPRPSSLEPSSPEPLELERTTPALLWPSLAAPEASWTLLEHSCLSLDAPGISCAQKSYNHQGRNHWPAGLTTNSTDTSSDKESQNPSS